jgi:hypothetical protein
VNDADGLERTGYGYMPKLDRVGLGLDYPGYEGLYLGVDKEHAGIGISAEGGKQQGFFGFAKPNYDATKEPNSFLGWIFSEGDKPLERKNVLVAK